jgi:hypothetical protein
MEYCERSEQKNFRTLCRGGVFLPLNTPLGCFVIPFAIFFGTSAQLKSSAAVDTVTAGSSLPLAIEVKSLGVILAGLSFDSHVFAD